MRFRGILDFLESPISIGWDLAPETAIAYLRGKGLSTDFDLATASAAERASAFWVANMADKDMLGDLLASLTDAAAKGTPFDEWSAGIIPTLRARGWWGDNGITPHRLQTIFRTNMQSALAVGHWERIVAQAKDAPYLMYDAVDDHRTRPLHHAWDNTVLPVNSPWWRTHFPPNGWVCRCGVIQLSAAELDDLGLTVSRPPVNGTYSWTNPRTGKAVTLPEGIDPGFDFNPGAERLAELQRLAGEKAKAQPPEAAKAIAASIDATRKAIELSFDGATAAGAWHTKSWTGAPEWLLRVAVREQSVSVTTTGNGAYAIGGQQVNMPAKYTVTNLSHQATWRHEFGHILDARIGERAPNRSTLYGRISAEPTFMSAMKADARDLAARTFVATTAQAEKRRALLEGYTRLQATLVDMPTADARLLYLRDRAGALGLDLDALRTALKAHSAALFDTLAGDIRLARILHAIEMGDAERFLAEAAGMEYGTPHGAGSIPAERAQVWATVRESWRKGLLGEFADLIGAATRNRIASINAGFPGHTEAYYRKRAGFGQGTEVFANLTTLAGAPEAVWWDLASRFVPRLVRVFEEIIRNAD